MQHVHVLFIYSRHAYVVALPFDTNKILSLCPSHIESHSKTLLLHMLQKGKSVLWRASFEGHTEIVLLLLHHHAAVDLPNDVRHSNTMYTVDIHD